MVSMGVIKTSPTYGIVVFVIDKKRYKLMHSKAGLVESMTYASQRYLLKKSINYYYF